ncbi:MAG: chromate transporter [Synergistaceae bacterium]|jgi:chromate transporter|nr:chromate transporter [Synergistaceae bacterium]
MIYLQLFLSFFQIGLFSFGGGMAAMPLIQNQVVDIRGWLTLAEFTDLIAISEITPGPIAINSATFVGTQIAGLPGALASTFGYILPSCVIVSSLAWLYGKYRELTALKGVLACLRPTAVALIFSAGLSVLVLSLWGTGGFTWDAASIDFLAAALFAAGLFLLRKFKMNPVLVILVCGVISGICQWAAKVDWL